MREKGRRGKKRGGEGRTEEEREGERKFSLSWVVKF